MSLVCAYQYGKKGDSRLFYLSYSMDQFQATYDLLLAYKAQLSQKIDGKMILLCSPDPLDLTPIHKHLLEQSYHQDGRRVRYGEEDLFYYLALLNGAVRSDDFQDPWERFLPWFKDRMGYDYTPHIFSDPNLFKPVASKDGGTFLQNLSLLQDRFNQDLLIRAARHLMLDGFIPIIHRPVVYWPSDRDRLEHLGKNMGWDDPQVYPLVMSEGGSRALP